jgi:hypothetical protein
MTLIPKNWPSWARHLVVAGGSAGIGATAMLTLVDKEHYLIVETFRGWGAQSLIAIVAIVVCSNAFNRVIDVGTQMIQVGRDGALAQQNLADAVREMVNKDDREKEEQRRLLSYVGTQQEKILNAIDELSTAVNTKARGASA